MIQAIILWSVRNRVVVLLLALLTAAWGVVSVRQTPVDAIPDLSDVQVIIRTSFPGQAPVRPNLSMGDTLAGLHAALGLAADEEPVAILPVGRLP